MRLVQISDTHVSHRGGATNENFQKIARFINEQLKPDAVVHSGDIMILDPDNVADRSAAKELLGLIDAPLFVIPGTTTSANPETTPSPGSTPPATGSRRTSMLSAPTTGSSSSATTQSWALTARLSARGSLRKGRSGIGWTQFPIRSATAPRWCSPTNRSGNPPLMSPHTR
ncbi:metallophosphoesterase family protein [Arthrobacter alkaliphilus]|uniref:metallophosphoesterase family protein n=1 Tax=Arthrobacter alkaliphilus TaxID=369936 RepID=UPI001F2CD7F9|nr:metallophosphoesterase [Arthrobacter alkaliphilus]